MLWCWYNTVKHNPQLVLVEVNFVDHGGWPSCQEGDSGCEVIPTALLVACLQVVWRTRPSCVFVCVCVSWLSLLYMLNA